MVHSAESPIFLRLKGLCNERGTSINALFKEVGAGNGNLPTWKKGHIRTDYLISICQIFDVSANWLLTGEEPSSPHISPAELALIENYRALSPDKKKAIETLLE